jgi:hypothetical protein
VSGDRHQQFVLAAGAKRQVEKETRSARLLTELRALIDDKEFVKLRTQAAMREYALEKFPQLQNVSALTLKQEISQW